LGGKFDLTNCLGFDLYQIIVMTQIIDHLYIGGIQDVNDAFIKTNQIQTVINVAKECLYELSTVTDQNDIKYYHFEIVDDEIYDISEALYIISSIINKSINKGSILIHCMAGVSRSPTFVLAYLIRYTFTDLAVSFHNVRKSRRVLPNPCFMKQLMNFEKEVLGSNSYSSYIDEYTTFFIMNSLQIDISELDDVRNIYINSDRNIWETVRRYTSKTR